ARSSTRPKRPSAASGPEPFCRLVSGDDDTRTNAHGEGSFCGAGITAAWIARASYRLHSAPELSWLARSNDLTQCLLLIIVDGRRSEHATHHHRGIVFDGSLSLVAGCCQGRANRDPEQTGLRPRH